MELVEMAREDLLLLVQRAPPVLSSFDTQCQLLQSQHQQLD
jgi:hypothetical protein